VLFGQEPPRAGPPSIRLRRLHLWGSIAVMVASNTRNQTALGTSGCGRVGRLTMKRFWFVSLVALVAWWSLVFGSCVGAPRPAARHWGPGGLARDWESALARRDPQALESLFWDSCLRHCPGFRFEPDGVLEGSLLRARWAMRAKTGSLGWDLTGALSSFARVDRAVLRTIWFDRFGQRRARALMWMEVDGVLRSGHRRSDRGWIRLELGRRAWTGPWLVIGMEPVQARTFVGLRRGLVDVTDRLGLKRAGRTVLPGSTGQGHFSGRVSVSVRVVDLDGDGNTDLALARGHRIEIWRNRSGRFVRAWTGLASAAVTDLHAEDVNRDGRMDLVLAGTGQVLLGSHRLSQNHLVRHRPSLVKNRLGDRFSFFPGRWTGTVSGHFVAGVAPGRVFLPAQRLSEWRFDRFRGKAGFAVHLSGPFLFSSYGSHHQYARRSRAVGSFSRDTGWVRRVLSHLFAGRTGRIGLVPLGRVVGPKAAMAVDLDADGQDELVVCRSLHSVRGASKSGFADQGPAYTLSVLRWPRREASGPESSRDEAVGPDDLGFVLGLPSLQVLAMDRGDLDGDGAPDLVLITPAGLKVYRNLVVHGSFLRLHLLDRNRRHRFGLHAVVTVQPDGGRPRWYRVTDGEDQNPLVVGIGGSEAARVSVLFSDGSTIGPLRLSAGRMHVIDRAQAKARPSRPATGVRHSVVGRSRQGVSSGVMTLRPSPRVARVGSTRLRRVPVGSLGPASLSAKALASTLGPLASSIPKGRDLTLLFVVASSAARLRAVLGPWLAAHGSVAAAMIRLGRSGSVSSRSSVGGTGRGRAVPSSVPCVGRICTVTPDASFASKWAQGPLVPRLLVYDRGGRLVETIVGPVDAGRLDALLVRITGQARP